MTLSADKLSVTDREPLLNDEEVPYQSFPAVKIGLLAGDKRAKGVGKALMLWAFEFVAMEISQRLGVRFMTVDALYDPDDGYDISGYYATFGFQYVNPNEPLPPKDGYRTMYFDLLPLIVELKS
jgi:GNAT superfamily N-acetyltransferase